MKKAIYPILTAALALTMSLPTAAAGGNIGGTDGSQNIDVKAKYVDSTVSGTVYSVDVAWGAMEFTYTRSGSKDWDPTNHDYVDRTTSAWTASGNEIRVTNHSNTAVKASFAYQSADGYTAVSGNFSHADVTLPSAVGKATDSAELTGETTLTLTGELNRDTTAATKIGNVTVTISK